MIQGITVFSTPASGVMTIMTRELTLSSVAVAAEVGKKGAKAHEGRHLQKGKRFAEDTDKQERPKNRLRNTHMQKPCLQKVLGEDTERTDRTASQHDAHRSVFLEEKVQAFSHNRKEGRRRLATR